MSRLRVALIGSRGIPARYGGYETLMEELSTRLVQMDIDVTVYCRSHNTPYHLGCHEGVRLIVLPTLQTKHLDTPIHTLLSCLHAFRQSFDAALVVNSVNAIFLPLLRAAGTPVALHVDGIERQRAKWGRLGRWAYSLSERLAARLPDALITDARVIHDYYLSQHQARSKVITYGVDPRPVEPGDTLQRLGLESRRFFLYVSRFEPENNPHRVAEAYRMVGGELPLVMVGGAPYADRFVRGFTQGADSRILFPGPIYGEGYRELLSHALAYIHATEVGGTHPALVEAMGFGNCVIVNDTPENREVADDSGLYFEASSPATLAQHLQALVADPRLREQRGRRAAALASERFTWPAVAKAYAELFAELAGGTAKS
jgi:glycosyltransferase involved in cell wall biosynthesis